MVHINKLKKKEILGSCKCMYGYGLNIDITYQVNHRTILKMLSYQNATVLGIHGENKSKPIMINQSLTKKSVSAHHSIKLLLNCNA